MENLIRAKEKLPFVHVDITSLNSAGASQITGVIGGGETNSSTTSPGVMGALSAISRVVTRPFAYSVSPQRSETLSITTTPALGSQALASPTSAASESQCPAPAPPIMEETRITTIRGTPTPQDEKGPLENTITEKTPRTTKPKTVTIYDLYEQFARCHLSRDVIQPNEGKYVPGTLKKWRSEGRTEYYFIANNCTAKDAYYEFCKALFTKGQAGSLEKQVQQNSALLEAVKTQQAAQSLR